MTVTFSVFIPVYNDARWLGGAIESVLAQTYPHFELVIGDNASDRDIASIVAGYPDERIRFHRSEDHVDVASSHNRTVAMCVNDWTLLLSADDRMHPTSLEKMAAEIERSEAAGIRPAMVVAPCRPVDPEGKSALFDFSGSWRVKHLPSGTYDARAWLRHVAEPGQVPWNVGSVAVGRHVTQVMGGFFRTEIGLSMDLDMALRAGAYGPVIYIDEPLVDYTVRPGGINKEMSRTDRATARMPTVARALLSGLAVHEARREVGEDERRYVRKTVADAFIGRALQHRYLTAGGGRRAALADLWGALAYDRSWLLRPRQVARGAAALVAPSSMIVRTKDRFRRSGRTF